MRIQVYFVPRMTEQIQRPVESVILEGETVEKCMENMTEADKAKSLFCWHFVVEENAALV